jgi:hypothetical protein
MMVWASNPVVRSEPNDEATNLFLRPGRCSRRRLRRDRSKGGEIYLCNARCLCIWAVTLATKPGLSEELKARRLVLKVPAGEELVFETIIGLARWASSHALGTAE